MNEQYDRKQQLQDGRDKLAQLEQRTLEEIAPHRPIAQKSKNIGSKPMDGDFACDTGREQHLYIF